ncbi:AbrB/MazE/SpoVT family DNA-binding domain-containing protein [candidate division WWE3 bacterium]|nr:AbrB/MazE/SpoVT family DNA-binding domain-containing protein [candidate division WWE3 bacterium]
MNQTSISKKGQVVIPKPIRDALDIKPADKLQVELLDDSTILIKPYPTLEEVYGMFKVKKPIKKGDIKRSKENFIKRKFS